MGQRITSRDVARAAGVSQTTVSFVLNGKPGQSIPVETRRRILDAARQLDYRPHASARTLAAGRSSIVLLSIPDLPIGAGISHFVAELAAALAGHGLTLVTHLAGAHERPLADVCAAVDASVVIGLTSFDAGTVQALHRAGADVVLPDVPDDADGMMSIGRLQAGHLIGCGHRRIGYAMPADPALRPMAGLRLRGVTDACRDAGLGPPLVQSVDLEIDSAAEAAAEWRARSVTGVCAFNDETAIAVLAGMRARGVRAPDGIAVIGADDIPTARLAAPPLTTVAFDLHEVARRRAEAVVGSLRGRDVHAGFPRVHPRVVHRASA